MPVEADGKQELIQPRHPTVLWVDDDDTIFQTVIRDLIRDRVEHVTFDNHDALLNAHWRYLSEDLRRPFLGLVALRQSPRPDVFKQLFSRVSFTGVVSDLEIGGNPLAGMVVLSAATSSQFKPETALYSARIEPPTRELAEALRVTHLISKGKHGIEELERVLSIWLGIPLQSKGSPNLAVQDLERLRRENTKLKKEKRKLEEDVRGLTQKRVDGTVRAKKTTTSSENVTEIRNKLIDLERQMQMVHAHHHDLTNTSSLTVQALDQLMNDPRLLPPVILGEIERAHISAKHCDVLVSSLTALTTKKGKAQKVDPSSVERALRESLQITQRKIPPTVSIESHIPPRLPLGGIPEHLLVRCMLNLILNSLEAMPEGGRIQVQVNPPKGRSKYIEITVNDNGNGIKRVDIGKVFSPDFSTKGKQQGLGLFIVRKVLDDFGGKIFLESVRGKGTKVVLQIPIA